MNKAPLGALAALILLTQALPSYAEETKTSSFFSGARGEKKFPSIQTLFSKKPKEPVVSKVDKITAVPPAGAGPKTVVKMPPAPPKVVPRQPLWVAPKLPSVAQPPKNPNARYVVNVPRPPANYLPTEIPESPEVTEATAATAEPIQAQP
jgi:hypothetical protein